MTPNTNTPSTDPYKGVRDFYPEDQFVQRYLYAIMRETAESFGYEEYDASLLEPAELYEAKSSEEIVNEQTYTFTDRGERRVTLRPEMTPTVARMVAKRRKELSMPLRWFTIANLFRYERPQKGRLREHIQLNADLFGLSGHEADIEIIELAAATLLNAGATVDDFTISISSRGLLNDLFELYGVDAETRPALTRLLDKKNKMDEKDFRDKASGLLGERTDDFLATVSSAEATAKMLGDDHKTLRELKELLTQLHDRGITNAAILPTLVRGFDYYTGMVFEVYDTDPDNNRSMFGGGRYDNLLATFGAEPTPAVGFGMGDVTLYEFLASRDLIPAYRSNADLALCRVDDSAARDISALADRLRGEQGLHVRVDLTGRKIGDQINNADKAAIPFVICVGPNEIKSGEYTIKQLSTGAEKTVPEGGILDAMEELATTDEESPEWTREA
ncbi:MAG: histidine--tRNA ligase [Candidatus Paceibacterota bacterium]